jgi:hypothetical protein
LNEKTIKKYEEIWQPTFTNHLFGYNKAHSPATRRFRAPTEGA